MKFWNPEIDKQTDEKTKNCEMSNINNCWIILMLKRQQINI